MGKPRSVCTAPGKIILLGEHSVVFGKPAVALAIDRYMTCTVSESDDFLLNGHRASLKKNPHLSRIMDVHGLKGLAVNTDSTVPPSSGLGSSAALSVSFSGAVRTLLGLDASPESMARDGFDAEYYSQGRASPIDSSVSAQGGGVGINCPAELCEPLWRVERDGRVWDVSSVKTPEMTLVVGNTGIKAATGPLVEKVRKYKERNRFASDIVDEMGSLAEAGLRHMSRGDLVSLGACMTQNHKLLSILGVSCPELNKLVKAALPHSFGAKLTGSGGGGSMVALTDSPGAVCDAIRKRGGEPHVVTAGVAGASARFL
ncbi:MAG: mevalonate kinase [Thermoplasmatales archaeon]|nr:mevalonate kinase [Thermoplasmatales archaeon]